MASLSQMQWVAVLLASLAVWFGLAWAAFSLWGRWQEYRGEATRERIAQAAKRRPADTRARLEVVR